MAKHLRAFVGIGAVVLVLARLGRVLEPVVDTPDWRIVAALAAVGGAVVAFALARRGVLVQVIAHLLGVVFLAVRVAAPSTLDQGFVPTSGTADELGRELAYALDVLQFGAPPVLAVSGMVVLVGMAMWVLGAAWAMSTLAGPPGLGLVPALGFYLYLAVVDRAPAATGWNLAFAVLMSLALAATGNPVTPGTGRMRSLDHRPLPRWHAGPALWNVAILALVGIFGAAAFASSIPQGGALEWRNPGGEGSGLGGGSFSGSRFAGLRQSIVSLSDDPVFVATVVPDLPGGPQAYWRLLTLDTYDGSQWRVGDQGFTDIGDLTEPLSTQRIRQTVRIESLSDDRLPVLFEPVSLASEEPVLRSGATLGTDGTIQVGALTFEGLTYRIESNVPTVDVAELASQDGALTPLFSEANAAGLTDLTPVPANPITSIPPSEVESLRTLPEGLDPAVGALARDVTTGTVTDFEAGVMLESFLRTFDYSTEVSSGQSSLELVAWLTDPESLNYRVGYCEQFATAMAVMGRTLGLPTRIVIGFTGGEETQTSAGPLTVVRQRNAHAWVEVFLEGAGWVAFDPTPRGDGTTSSISAGLGFNPNDVELEAASNPVGVDSSDQPIFDVPPNLPGSDLTTPGQGNRPLNLPTWTWIAMVLAAGGAAIPLWKRRRTKRRRSAARTGDIEAAWDEIVDRLTDLGAGPDSHLTPIEFAAETDRNLMPLANSYSAALYGKRPAADAGRHLEPAETWIDVSFDRRSRLAASMSLRSLGRRR